MIDEFKIVSISVTAKDKFESEKVFGLGSNGGIYYWSTQESKWSLYARNKSATQFYP